MVDNSGQVVEDFLSGIAEPRINITQLHRRNKQPATKSSYGVYS